MSDNLCHWAWHLSELHWKEMCCFREKTPRPVSSKSAGSQPLVASEEGPSLLTVLWLQLAYLKPQRMELQAVWGCKGVERIWYQAKLSTALSTSSGTGSSCYKHELKCNERQTSFPHSALRKVPLNGVLECTGCMGPLATCEHRVWLMSLCRC